MNDALSRSDAVSEFPICGSNCRIENHRRHMSYFRIVRWFAKPGFPSAIIGPSHLKNGKKNPPPPPEKPPVDRFIDWVTRFVILQADELSTRDCM